jgi:alkylated DNA repair dioxygenase AlkB
MPDFLSKDHHQRLLEWVESLEFHNGYSRDGRQIDRAQLWFHQDGEYFDLNWKQRHARWCSHSYTPILYETQNVIQQVVASLPAKYHININSCLINKYKDGSCFIPKHKDNPIRFGTEPTIIGLSLGQTRTFRTMQTDTELYDNSVFVMAGPSMEHEILQTTDQGCRYSLTFRAHMSCPDLP